MGKVQLDDEERPAGTVVVVEQQQETKVDGDVSVGL